MDIAIIGCGVMGSAFARKWAEHGHLLRLYNRSKGKAETLAAEIGGEFFESAYEACQGADLLLLAMKPKDLEVAGQDLKGLKSHQIVLSVLSGITIERLKGAIRGAAIVRTMPNLALTCGKGIIAVAKDSSLSEEVKEHLKILLKPLGKVIWAKEEELDAITALAGSGPSFACSIIEAFTEAGIEQGLRSEIALQLTIAMIEGAIGLIQADKVHPAVIRYKICSPGGATIAGHRALEEYRVQAGIMAAIEAAYNKARGSL